MSKLRITLSIFKPVVLSTPFDGIVSKQNIFVGGNGCVLVASPKWPANHNAERHTTAPPLCMSCIPCSVDILLQSTLRRRAGIALHTSGGAKTHNTCVNNLPHEKHEHIQINSTHTHTSTTSLFSPVREQCALVATQRPNVGKSFQNPTTGRDVSGRRIRSTCHNKGRAATAKDTGRQRHTTTMP